MNRDEITIVILLAGMATGVFTVFCPSWFAVGAPEFHAGFRDGNIRRCRQGEAMASVIVVGTGLAASARSRSPLPLLTALGICAVFIGAYEYMIAHGTEA